MKSLSQNSPHEKEPLLLYAESCPKCRFLSRCVVLLSFNTIHRVPLERPEWEKFYWEDYPQARGYPVLFVKGQPIFGARVFGAVPLLLLRTWINAAFTPFKRKRTSEVVNREKAVD